MTETVVNGYSSESTQRELSNEYQHDRVLIVIKNVNIDEGSLSIVMVNPSNANATFVQSTRMLRFLETI